MMDRVLYLDRRVFPNSNTPTNFGWGAGMPDYTWWEERKFRARKIYEGRTSPVKSWDDKIWFGREGLWAGGLVARGIKTKKMEKNKLVWFNVEDKIPSAVYKTNETEFSYSSRPVLCVDTTGGCHVMRYVKDIRKDVCSWIGESRVVGGVVFWASLDSIDTSDSTDKIERSIKMGETEFRGMRFYDEKGGYQDVKLVNGFGISKDEMEDVLFTGNVSWYREQQKRFLNSWIEELKKIHDEVFDSFTERFKKEDI